MCGAVLRCSLVLALLSLSLIASLPPASASVSSRPLQAAHPMGYGANTLGIDSGSLDRLQGIGFNRATAWVHWTSNPDLNRIRTEVDAARARGFSVLLKVRYSTTRACPPPGMESSFANFMASLATTLSGRGVAYEIFNEPNLTLEWGGAWPDPAYYARLLRAAYPRIKAADSSAIVVTAGLATTGGDSGAAMNDETFIRRIYDPNSDGNLSDGAKGYFDALGSHPYGFAYPPDHNPASTPLCFRRAELHHQLMVQYGDGNKPIWATEFGWIIDPAQLGSPCRLSSDRDWQKVSPQQQADYLVRAYQYACSNWPWMGAMFLFNLDFDVAYWYAECEQMRFYSIYGRPAYTALMQMPKTCLLPPSLAVQPTSLTFIADPSGPDPSAQRVTVSNLGTGTLQWTATDDRSWITVSPASGSAIYGSPSTISVTVSKSGLPQGYNTGQITVSAAGAEQSPQIIEVTLYVGPLHHVFVPLTTKNASGP